MTGKEVSTGKVLDWLLEPDDIGVRYLALRDLVKEDGRELENAKKQAHAEGPIAEVLSNMDEEGFWAKPGAGYFPMYTATAWAVILLAQLGADINFDNRIAKACDYTLENSLTRYGQFTMTGTPAGTLDCLQGNLCWALAELGCTDSRLDDAWEWMARSVTGEGVAPMTDKSTPIRYYSRDKVGPNFACRGTRSEPCAWGAVKVMMAFGQLPAEKRTPMVESAIRMGVDFLLSKDPVEADYPLGWSNKPTGKPSRNWWKFGFPVFYSTDVLQNVEALVRLGYGKDPRLANAVNYIIDKQDVNGRWLMEYNYAGKTWIDSGPNRQPNKWVTLRALRVLDMLK
ncbi:MAG: nitrogen fixation protein NifH [Dehalococcoidales bacterium]|nr:nitrogen fixation protein NifH [Dehalococcoidales bacterium]